jgi:hypothetical protein
MTFGIDGRMETPPCSSKGGNEGMGKKPEEIQVFPRSFPVCTAVFFQRKNTVGNENPLISDKIRIIS